MRCLSMLVCVPYALGVRISGEDPTPPSGDAHDDDFEAVAEKFGEQNFRVFSEMRGKILYYNPKK